MMKHVIVLFMLMSVIFAQDTIVVGTLQWQDNSKVKTIKRDWKFANEYCDELSLAGKNDWRLPTILELYSITDKKRFEPAIKKEFKNTANNYYWSSSEYVSDKNYAWYIYFGNGSINRNSKSSDFFVRCIRDK